MHVASRNWSILFNKLKARSMLTNFTSTWSSGLPGRSCITLSLVLGQKMRLLLNRRRPFRISGTMGQSVGSPSTLMSSATRQLISLCWRWQWKLIILPLAQVPMFATSLMASLTPCFPKPNCHSMLTVSSTLAIFMPLLNTWWTKSHTTRSTSSLILLVLAAVLLAVSRHAMIAVGNSRCRPLSTPMRNRPTYHQLKRPVSKRAMSMQMGTLTMAAVAGVVVVTINNSTKIAANGMGTPRVMSSEPLLHLSLLFPRMLLWAAHMGGWSSDDNDAKPSSNGKMGANLKNLCSLRQLKRRRNDARLCLLGMTHSGVIFVLLSLLSH